AQTWALTLNDSTITGNLVGLARPMSYAGTWYADDFRAFSAAGDQSPPKVVLSAVAAPLTGVTTLQPTVTDETGVARVAFYVDGGLRATAPPGPFNWAFDTSTATNGTHTLTVKAYDLAGNVGSASQVVQTQNANALADPVIPAQYGHIRVAQLAYSLSQIDSF